MLYVTWELLNLAALLFLLWAIYKAAQILAREWGILKTSLFGFLLLSMASSKPQASSPVLTTFRDISSLRNGIYLPVISDQLINRLSLVVIKGSSPDSTVATVAQNFSGLIMGHKWEPLGPGTYRFQHDHLTYDSPQLLRWNLLGINIYTQLKRLQGTTILRN